MQQKKLPTTPVRLRLLVKKYLLTPPWLPPQKRAQRRDAASGRVLTDFMQKHLLAAANAVAVTSPQKDDTGERIFSIWLQGEENAPEIVRSCFFSIREHCSQPLVVLDGKTVFDWISLPQPIVDKYRAGSIKPAQFTDICRVELLHRYGGYWLDATCFVSAPIPSFITEQDFFVFMAGEKVRWGYSFIQNCFIRARKGAYLLEAWRAMILDYWLRANRSVDYFQHQVMFRTLVANNPAARESFAAMPQLDQYPTHLYQCEYKDLPYDPEVLRKAAGEGFFYQKTTYRDLDAIVPGSFADRIVHWEATRDPGTGPESGLPV